jgi:8-oxo-dGTP pyrophosphatase MutT (NUDIX family)
MSRATHRELAVKAVVVDSERRVLLLRRSHEAISFAGLWEIPGGRLRAQETPVEGLRRELLEELGVEADIGRPLGVWDFVTGDGTLVVGITFHARIDQ